MRRRRHQAPPPRAALAALLVALVGCGQASAGAGRAAPSAPDAVPTSCAPRASASRFELVVLGSGGPRGFGRAASGYVVRVDGAPRILVDVGPGAFVRLGEMSLDFESLDTLLLTHLHIDHTGDVAAFVKSRDLSFDAPLTFRIFGPAGAGLYPSTTAFVDRLFGARGAFAYLPTFRNELRFAVTDLAIAPHGPIQDVLAERGLRVTAISVDHDDVPALAFRIEHDGHALVVSGDLASKTDDLVRLAAGADLLVYDTAVLDPPASPAKLYDLHTPPRRIGEVAEAARVKRLLLSHIPPPVDAARDEVLRSVRATFRGEVRFAEDCMHLDLTRP